MGLAGGDLIAFLRNLRQRKEISRQEQQHDIYQPFTQAHLINTIQSGSKASHVIDERPQRPNRPRFDGQRGYQNIDPQLQPSTLRSATHAPIQHLQIAPLPPPFPTNCRNPKPARSSSAKISAQLIIFTETRSGKLQPFA